MCFSFWKQSLNLSCCHKADLIYLFYFIAILIEQSIKHSNKNTDLFVIVYVYLENINTSLQLLLLILSLEWLPYKYV